jgi:hypothetical protein
MYNRPVGADLSPHGGAVMQRKKDGRDREHDASGESHDERDDERFGVRRRLR